MKVFGYSSTLPEGDNQEYTKEAFKDYSPSEVIFETMSPSKSIALNELVQKMEPEDTLLILELKHLGLSTRQLGDFFKTLLAKGCHFISLKEGISSKDDPSIFQLITYLAEMEKDLLTERTVLGLKKARKNGKIGGRPKINQKTIDKIRFLYFEEKETIPTIAKKCHVSVGSCYKYISLNK